MPEAYHAEFRRKVLELVTAGRSVAQVADHLKISQQVIYTWRRKALIGAGQGAGLSSSEAAELRSARRRIAQLGAELASIAGPRHRGRSCRRRLKTDAGRR